MVMAVILQKRDGNWMEGGEAMISSFVLRQRQKKSFRKKPVTIRVQCLRGAFVCTMPILWRILSTFLPPSFAFLRLRFYLLMDTITSGSNFRADPPKIASHDMSGVLFGAVFSVLLCYVCRWNFAI